MFFLLRSAICIGIVVAMLPEPGAPDVGVLASSAGATASAAIRHYCAQGARCAAMVGPATTWLLAGATGAIGSRHQALPSADTLLASDLLPAWRESGARSGS